MDDTNKKIVDRLKKPNSDQQFSEEQANTLQLIIRSFKGTFRLTFMLILIIQLAFAGLAIYCAYHLVNEVDIALKINWLAGTLAGVVAFAIARLWLFMELNRLSVIREVKRVEQQVALLTEQLSDNQSSE